MGLLPGSIVKERYAALPVAKAMTQRKDVFTVAQKDLGSDPIAVADAFFDEHFGVHKLLVVDSDDRLRGLFTLSDIERISDERSSAQKNARDSKFRLLCGASIALMRKPDGSLDIDSIISHVGKLIDEGLDVAAVSTAHGFTQGVGDAVKAIRKAFPEITIIGGNVTNAAGVEYLAECGADAIKIGQGPGSICTTRMVAGVGIPQLTALYVCSKQARKLGVRTIADGGITKSGDMVKALTLADAMICGGLLAGCPEAPGQVMEINGKMYKQYRGMGSLSAMKAGSAARYGRRGSERGFAFARQRADAVRRRNPERNGLSRRGRPPRPARQRPLHPRDGRGPARKRPSRHNRNKAAQKVAIFGASPTLSPAPQTGRANFLRHTARVECRLIPSAERPTRRNPPPDSPTQRARIEKSRDCAKGTA